MTDNAAIARVFYDIADLLEIKGDNPFRIRSYRNAALVIEGMPEELSTLFERGQENLEHITTIGSGIREKIVEIITSGRCAYYDDLTKELPKGILELLKVGGVGPKKAARLYKELGIKGVEDLEKAARAGRLRDLEGFGEKSEEKILKAISDRKAVSGRHNIALAWHAAASIAGYLKALPGVKEALPAGSLRRWKESIGDIDILVASKNAGPVMDAFVGHADVVDVLQKGETKSTVVLKTGIQADLRVVDESEFGAALQYFTGSKAHNIAVRDRAKRMGLKISEYGVFNEKTGKKVAGRTEEEVYRAVGLPYIPPELRENGGEIEAAEEGALPEPLEMKHIRGDLHAHTHESDGSADLDEIAEAAQKLGYEYVAITDHSKAVGIAHGLDEKRVTAQMRRIEAFNEKLYKKGARFRLLKGAEVDIRADGTLDHPDSVLEKLDCVVAAVHSGFTMPMDRMTERVIKAIRTGRVNVIAHPTGRLISSRPPYSIDMNAVMDEAKKHNVFLEVNSYPDRLDLNDSHCRLAREKGLKVAVSTDMHALSHFSNMVYGVHTARRGWIEKKDVINTRTLKELMKLLKR